MQTEPRFRIFDLTLKEKVQITPSLVRCIFTGPDVHLMKYEAPDQRIKIFVPNENGDQPLLQNSGDWYQTFRALPAQSRPAARTYTLRALRKELNEMDVEFVLHGDSSPASKWATYAKIGDFLQAAAPNSRYGADCGGYHWLPPKGIKNVLLVGDETALPALMGVLEQMATWAEPPVVQAFIEVPKEADCLSMIQFPFADVTWIARDIEGGSYGDVLYERVVKGANIPTSALEAMVNEVPEETLGEGGRLWELHETQNTDFYAWLAANSTTIKRLRRYLLGERKVAKDRVNLMAYWG